MTETLTEAEVQAFLSAHPGATGIDMIMPDMCGIPRGKRIGTEAAAKLYRDGVQMPGSTFLLDSTGQNCETIAQGTVDGDPDFPCLGVSGSLTEVPWARQKTAQVIASMSHRDGTPYFADPRHVLDRAVQPLRDMGLTPVSAMELEFYLLDPEPGPDGRPRPAKAPDTGTRQSTTQVYGMEELYDFEAFLVDVEAACQAQNIPADTATSEYGPGQYEINLHHVDDPLLACDQTFLLKRLIKGVARRHGMIACFMAKPFAELAGCGLHVHVSLVDKDGKNTFAGPLDPEVGLPVGPTIRHAVGGLRATMAEGMALFAPNANSYRRFQHGSYAPINRAWGSDNRTVSLRLPDANENAVRVEHRVAGADANPYLVMAAVLSGIHHGLANQIDPGPAEKGDAYAKPQKGLPFRWWQAVDKFEKGKVLPGYLGSEYSKVYAAARRFESDAFQSHISMLDYEWYMRAV